MSISGKTFCAGARPLCMTKPIPSIIIESSDSEPDGVSEGGSESVDSFGQESHW